jgi:hypothetical protein
MEKVQIMLGLNIFVKIYMSILRLKLFIKKKKRKTIPSSTKEQVGEVHVWKFTILVRKNKKKIVGKYIDKSWRITHFGSRKYKNLVREV